VTQGSFLLVTGSIFALIALLHALRLVYGGTDLSLYAGYWRVEGAMPELVVDGLPDLSRWAEAMAARPAIQRALKF